MNIKIFYFLLVMIIGILIGYSIIATKYIYLRERYLDVYQTLQECQYSEMFKLNNNIE